MIPPSTSDQENYNGYLIVSNSRYLGPHAWTYTVEIQTPNGKWLPTIKDHDNTFDTSEAAVAEGMRAGRSVVGR
ncbi:hypothetical protein GCM10027431_13700 [Lysobacter rhizosphaerae]